MFVRPTSRTLQETCACFEQVVSSEAEFKNIDHNVCMIVGTGRCTVYHVVSVE